MSNDISTQNPNLPVSADLVQQGETNLHVTNQNGGVVNVNYILPDNSGGGETAKLMAIQSFSKQYYQLIVTCEDDIFDTEVVSVMTNRALCERLVPPEIYKRCSDLSDQGIEELKRIPAVICQENTKLKAETDQKQLAVYAYITRIKKAGKNIKIAYKPIGFFHQIKMCDKHNAMYFDLNMDSAVTDLNRSEWSVHKVNLFEAFDEAGIPNMPRPM